MSSLDNAFNDIVCLDHFRLEDLTLFHIMDVATRYSSRMLCRRSQLVRLNMDALHSDGASQTDVFKPFLNRYYLQLRPVPPRFNEKNKIELRPGVIHPVFIRLRQAHPNANIAVLAAQAECISNDLYGNDTVSSSELAEGLSSPLLKETAIPSIPNDIVEAHINIVARRKLNRILRLHAFNTDSFKPGNMTQVYLKNDTAKLGSWSSPCIILSIDQEGGFVVAPGRSGKRASATFEDTRAKPYDNPLDAIV